MGGLNLPEKSASVDWLRKNEPRGDMLTDEKIWDSSSHEELNIFPSTTLLYIIKGIEIIVEMKSGESIPTISGDDVKLHYPETESLSIVSQKYITITTNARGLDGLLEKCNQESLKTLDLSGFTGAKFIFGFINLNYVLLDGSLDTTQKQVLLQAGDNITIGGTGRIIFRVKGWKIFKSDW